jgi:hypothetical protein
VEGVAQTCGHKESCGSTSATRDKHLVGIESASGPHENGTTSDFNREVTMRTRRAILSIGAAMSLLGGCMHHKNRTYGSLAGDVDVDSLSATRTAVLRVQSAYSSEVRIYTVIDGKANYVAKAMPGQTTMKVLDPNLFPAKAMTFEARPADGGATRTLGPYNIQKGETIEIVVPESLDAIRGRVHRTTP